MPIYSHVLDETHLVVQANITMPKAVGEQNLLHETIQLTLVLTQNNFGRKKNSSWLCCGLGFYLTEDLGTHVRRVMDLSPTTCVGMSTTSSTIIFMCFSLLCISAKKVHLNWDGIRNQNSNWNAFYGLS